MSGVSSLNALTGALAITSANAYISVGASTSNVSLQYNNIALNGLTAGGSNFTTGIVGLAGSNGITLTPDTLNNVITISGGGSSSGSSITNGTAPTNGSVSVSGVGSISMTTANQGIISVGDTSANPARQTFMNVGPSSTIKMLNGANQLSANMTFFNDQSNTSWTNLNTSAVAGYFPNIGTPAVPLVVQGGGQNLSAYADFGAGRHLVLGSGPRGLVPTNGATIPYLTASQSGTGATNAVKMTVSAGGAGIATNATSIDLVADTITHNGVPFTGGGGAITAGGATVACDDPAGSGSITLTTTATGTQGDLTIDTTTGHTGVIAIKGLGDISIDTTTSSGGGLRILTHTTTSIFEDTNVAGVAGQIQFTSTDATNPAKVSIGGTSNATGLYVSNTQLLFNGAAVTAPGNAIAANGALVACDDPAGTGSITISTNNNRGAVIIDTTRGGSAGAVAIITGADISIDTTTDGNSGIVMKTNKTISYFDHNSIGSGAGVSGQIQFTSTDATNPATVSIGGTSNATGLYVSNTRLVFNGVIIPQPPVVYNVLSNISGNTLPTPALFPMEVVSIQNPYPSSEASLIGTINGTFTLFAGVGGTSNNPVWNSVQIFDTINGTNSSNTVSSPVAVGPYTFNNTGGSNTYTTPTINVSFTTSNYNAISGQEYFVYFGGSNDGPGFADPTTKATVDTGSTFTFTPQYPPNIWSP